MRHRAPTERDQKIADHRMLCRQFGIEHVRGRDIVCLWNDITSDHDWCVAIVKDAEDNFYVLERLASDIENFVHAAPMDSKALTSIYQRLKDAQCEDDRHVERESELFAAMDLANKAANIKEIADGRLWAASALESVGRQVSPANTPAMFGMC